MEPRGLGVLSELKECAQHIGGVVVQTSPTPSEPSVPEESLPEASKMRLTGHVLLLLLLLLLHTASLLLRCDPLYARCH
jgi:hypothetical protein